MQVWTKVRLKEYNKKVDNISKSFTNYLYGYGPISDLQAKYDISDEDRHMLDQYMANRIGGLVMLYIARDTKRINDIVNKYNIPDGIVEEVVPEIEGYINK